MTKAGCVPLARNLLNACDAKATQFSFLLWREGPRGKYADVQMESSIGTLRRDTKHGGRFIVLEAKYGHTNLIARDWRKLASFYESVFGCVPVPPERNLSGDAVERASMVPQAALQGVHLRLPGFGPDGPTLEIFTYNTLAVAQTPVANRPGYGHIAFIVSDVPEAVAVVVKSGGSQLGEVVTTPAGHRYVTWTYVRDPEGNLVELQSWSP